MTRKYRVGAPVIYTSDKIRNGIVEGDVGWVIGLVDGGYIVQFTDNYTSLRVRGDQIACVECEGSGITVVGWDPATYENIEGPCPYCYGPEGDIETLRDAVACLAWFIPYLEPKRTWQYKIEGKPLSAYDQMLHKAKAALVKIDPELLAGNTADDLRE